MNIRDAKTMRENADKINMKIKSDFIKEIELDIEKKLEDRYKNGDYSLSILYHKRYTKIINIARDEIESIKKELKSLGYEVTIMRINLGVGGLEDFRIDISW